jgi:DNA-directed RNA polymerase specialized sigma24 family protein
LLHFVRNAAYSRLQNRRTGVRPAPGGGVKVDASPAISRSAEPLEAAAAALPIHLLECLVLREMEQLKYKEIAGITEVSIETVMSRLHRARRLLMAMTGRGPGQ